jgi:hypothetical protein
LGNAAGPVHAVIMRENVFILLIDQGRITDMEGLRRAYRRLVMKTHPDAIGSTRLVKEFLEFGEYYEAAKLYLRSSGRMPQSGAPQPGVNYRLEFFQQMKRLEAADAPYAYHRDERQIRAIKEAAAGMFRKWRPRGFELYARADHEHDFIKSEKPEGPYLKKALALNLSPVFHNVIMFHLTGRNVYRKQVRQNLGSILDRLEKSGHRSLKEHIEFLVADMEDGAAVFGDAASS